MPIFTTAPPAPSRSDPANFATEADTFVAWLTTFRAELEAWAWGSIDDAITPAAGHVLAHDGTEWAPRTVALETIGPFHVSDVSAFVLNPGRLMFAATSSTMATSVRDVKMPRAGRVVGARVVMNIGRSAGSTTLRLSINGVDTAFDGGSVALDATNTAADASLVSYANGVAFAAGDTLGAGLNSDASWAPGGDAMMWLTVAYAPF